VTEKYDWDYVVDRYEELFARMAAKALPPRAVFGTDAATPAFSEKTLSQSASA